MTPLTPAEQALVEANRGLAIKFGRQCAQRGSDESAMDDAVQEAMLALMRAARGFDPSRGFKFSTYASTSIIMDATKHRANAHRRRIKSECDVYDYSPEDHREKPACGLELAELAAAMASLDPRMRRVIEMRFRDGATLDEVGKAIGVTKECVRQIQLKATATLRKKIEGRQLVKRKMKGA